jgi:hypothetical protein
MVKTSGDRPSTQPHPDHEVGITGFLVDSPDSSIDFAYPQYKHVG